MRRYILTFPCLKEKNFDRWGLGGGGGSRQKGGCGRLFFGFFLLFLPGVPLYGIVKVMLLRGTPTCTVSVRGKAGREKNRSLCKFMCLLC